MVSLPISFQNNDFRSMMERKTPVTNEMVALYSPDLKRGSEKGKEKVESFCLLYSIHHSFLELDLRLSLIFSLCLSLSLYLSGCIIPFAKRGEGSTFSSALNIRP